MNESGDNEPTPRDEFMRKLERLLRDDPLLVPYFKKGYVRIIDRPGADPVWIDFTLKEKIQAFIKGRVMAVLLGMGDEQLEEGARRCDEREEMIRVLGADEVLRPYFEDGSISISNRPDSGIVEMDADSEKLSLIIERVIEVLRDRFGDIPEDNASLT